MIGAALAVGAGQVTQALFLGYFAQRTCPISYEWAHLWPVVPVALVLCGVISTTSGGPGLGMLAPRVVLLATFPLGLLAVRFFRPAEFADLRRLQGTLGARRGPVVSPTPCS